MEKFPSVQFSVGETGLRGYGGTIWIDQDDLCLIPGESPAQQLILRSGGTAGLAAGAAWGGIGGAVLGTGLGLAMALSIYGIGIVLTPPLPREYSDFTVDPVPLKIRCRCPALANERGGMAFVIPRASVTDISLSGWTGVTINSDKARFFIPVSYISIKAAREILVRFAWISESDDKYPVGLREETR